MWARLRFAVAKLRRGEARLKICESEIRFAVAKLRRGEARQRRAEADSLRQHFEKSMHYVYGLECKNGYYVGCTNDLKDRLSRHAAGEVPATTGRLPVKLVFYFAIVDKYKAFEFEKYLKSGSGRAFIKKHLS